jgi:hypothetical protein
MLGRGVTLLGSEPIEPKSLEAILRDALALGVHKAQIALCFYVTLVGG